MPLEGHWKRVHTPVRSAPRRERRAVAAVAAVLVVALAGGVLFAILHGGSSKAGAGCIEVTAAHSTGGATVKACGAGAARWCRSAAGRHDAFGREVLARCREAGYR